MTLPQRVVRSSPWPDLVNGSKKCCMAENQAEVALASKCSEPPNGARSCCQAGGFPTRVRGIAMISRSIVSIDACS
jgi:hypothetical protein